jgi:hypothetical protein
VGLRRQCRTGDKAGHAAAFIALHKILSPAANSYAVGPKKRKNIYNIIYLSYGTVIAGIGADGIIKAPNE